MDISFTKALSERYLAYALSTIVSRSLPDVRDGLKPVHRRLIYAMHELNLNPDAHFKKCARVVGDVMGKFHPHGDAAIYGAMVRLAQDFSVRYPLIEGQGNFGNVDGDSAAAMRYTEARLTPIALELLQGIEENAVDMKDNYDGETHEPLVLPSCFPNILANGATGIAVGMATSIPPHNLEELCLALISLIDSPDLSVHIPGPDFPTGGILVDDDATIQKVYETGKGSFRLRARFSYEIEKSGSNHIVITEIPYQVEKSQLIKKIADLIIEKKILNLEDIRDESTDDIRIVLDIKNKTNPYIIMEHLFKGTDLEVRVPINLNVLSAEQVPMVMSLADILKDFLKHRVTIQKRILETRLEKILKRLFTLEGYLVIYKHLDDVIKIIRFEDEPKNLISEKYHLKAEQIEAILNMRLRSLQKLQEHEIKMEHEKLTKEKISLEEILSSETKQKNLIKQDFKRLIKLFGKKTDIGMRRTTFEKIPEFSEEILEETIEKEDVIIVCSSKNWIRLVKTANDLRYKEGDQERFVIPSATTETLIVCTISGRFFTLPVHKIPKSRSTGYALRDWLNIEDDVLAIFAIDESIKEFLLISEDIKGFRVKVEDIIAQTRAGKQICTEGVVLKKCLALIKDTVLLVSSNRKMLALPVDSIPVLSKGKGVILQRATRLSDAILVDLNEGFSWIKKGKTFYEKDLRRWIGSRGSSGRLPPLNFPKENIFSA